MVARFITECRINDADDLVARDLALWLQRLHDSGLRPRTVRNYLVVIRSWVRWMIVNQVISSDPFQSVRTRRCDGDDGCVAITKHQAELLIANARSECDALDGRISRNAWSRYVAYVLMIDCGLRVGEVRRQRWQDIDLSQLTMRITHDKSRRNDRIPIGRRVAEVLNETMQRFGRSIGLVIELGPNAKKMRADLDQVGCRGEPGRFHRLRKFAITDRAVRGMPLSLLARWARHRDPSTTMRYVTPSVEQMRRFI